MPEPAADFDAAVAHRGGAALVLGVAGSGRTEVIARRFVGLVDDGVPGERIAVLAQGPATRTRLRDRIETLLDRPFEELRVHTWEELAEKLLRDYALEAGLDPFFEVVGPADRLAVMLDSLDELPLRRHEIRGNPAGLLARLLERIDVLKTEGIGSAELRERARAAERGAGGRAERETALRELEFADLFERHDAILLARGAIDEPELILELGRLLSRRPDVSLAIGDRFRELMVDELEDAGPARSALLPLIAPHEGVLATCDPAQGLGAFRVWGEAGAARFRAAYPAAGEFTLDRPAARSSPARRRDPGRRGPRLRRARARALRGGRRERCPSSDRAGLPPTAGATARVRSPAACGCGAAATSAPRPRPSPARSSTCSRRGECQPEDLCVVTGPAGREGRLVAAALEERNVPFRSSGSAAFFRRPEVRDVIAWLRALDDPGDSSAVVRALTRPPTELRSVDLARCTTIARRRKLDMISAIEAALESPQLPPPSRDRIRAFLKLYRAAAKALDRLSADVFVRRLIERVGFRRQGLFAASPETAERLVNLGRLAELAGSSGRGAGRDGSTREFIRYLSAVAEAGQRLAARSMRRRAAPSCWPSRASSRAWSSSASICSA